jgi:AcrR family transcriptional regulator
MQDKEPISFLAQKRTNESDKIVTAALNCSALQGWVNISMRDIADEAKISLADIYEFFDDKTDILVRYGRILDRKVMEAFPKFHPETPYRDRLFDILMERFDLANQDRAAILSILNSMKLDPKQMVISLPHLGLSMARMLELAGIDTNGIRGALRVAGIIALYVWVLRTWMNDDTKDLSKTMAALDKSLNRVDDWAKNYNL